MEHYDFSGYATRNNIRCSDGRTIRKNAFIDNDGVTVPLVWQHRHNSPDNVLGHALLENREDGVYAYGSFNDTAEGQRAKALVHHGDIKQLSIYANGLKQTPDGSVMHGNIREVSLVLAGANPGAYIQTLDIAHSNDPDYEEEYDAEIYTGENFTLQHADEKKKPDLKELTVETEKAVTEEAPAKSDEEDDEEEETKKKVKKTKVVTEEAEADSEDDNEDEEELKHSKNETKEETAMATNEKAPAKSGKTVQDVLNELTEEQMNVVAYLIGEAVSKNGGEAKHSDEEGDYLMHTNIFENQSPQDEFLAHADAFFDATETIIKDAKTGMRGGSLKENVIAHAAEYGIDNIDYLFPDAKNLENIPDFIQRDQEFVKEFMDRVHKSPFARIKSIHADITEAQARAKGYIKGKRKLEEVFTLLRRTTSPCTVYKKQKLDRDDIIDITDFDVVVWLKAEMRVMLNEELVRAMLVGDGRSAAADDKINEQCIRPIWTDDDLYTIKQVVNLTEAMTDNARAKAYIVAAIRARKNYKGTGSPIFFTTEDVLTEMLLITDDMGRDIYDTPEKLATKLRVSKIVTCEVLENLTRTVTPEGGSAQTRTLVGIIVNPADYNVGTDKGGEVSLFDDFDIDYNQQKYLIETRLSGALTKPYSAIALESVVNPT